MPLDLQEQTTASWMKEAQKGYIRVAVLILVNKKPAHGYEIMKEIKERTKGFWKPTAGGVYPILRSLEDAGYICGDWETKRNRQIKTYHLTESGKQILTRTLTKQNEIASNMNSLFREFSRDVLNMGATEFPVEAMASPFSVFFEDENEPNQKKRNSRKVLEQKRDHIRKMISTLQVDLERVEKELSKSEGNR
jgi:DNA-binding PadR family transcriptional regulator